MSDSLETHPKTEPISSLEAASSELAVDELLLEADSDRDPMLSVVMPTMNEEAGIAECIDQVREAICELGVTAEIIVSDSSTDRTPEIARECGAIVVEPDQPGYGYAYQYAFERTRGQFIAMGDADTTYDFSAIPTLLDQVTNGDADIVMGSRLAGEIKDGAMPWLHQYIGNPLLTRFLNAFYDAGVSDAHSGFRVFHRDVLEELEITANGMEFASEMVMAASVNGLDIEEVPIIYYPREGEATLNSFQDGWRHVKFMLLNAPSYLFAVPAGLLLMMGAIALTLSLLRIQIAGFSFSVHTAIAGSLLGIVGYQIASLAVFSAVVADPIRDVNDSITNWIIDHVTLEHGATIGLVVFVIGAVIASQSIIQWITSGFESLPLIVPNMVAFTAVVIGVQTVFYSFFLSLIGQEM